MSPGEQIGKNSLVIAWTAFFIILLLGFYFGLI
jgi:hypothetical protein